MSMEYPAIPLGTKVTSHGIELTMTEEGWRAEIQHTMMRRCRNWDYHKPWTYLLTIARQHHDTPPMPQGISDEEGNLLPLPDGWQYPQWLEALYARKGRPHLFGTLDGETEEDARIVLNVFGQKVEELIEELPRRYPQLRVLEHVVMPNHLHMVIRVVERLPEKEHLGVLVNRFKSAVNREYKRIALGLPDTTRMDVSYQKRGEGENSQPTAGRAQTAAGRNGHGSKNPKIGLVFEPGFHDRILFRKGQLERMMQYCKDNPKRLWQVVHNRQYFERLMRVGIALPYLAAGGTKGQARWSGEAKTLLDRVVLSSHPGAEGSQPAGESSQPAGESSQPPAERTELVTFSIMGNRSLLAVPEKMQIQCSRKAGETEITALTAEVLEACSHGVVPVSPCISPGEKAVARAVLEAGWPLIVLFPQGIPADMRNKANFGQYYDACANGQLLILSPWDYEAMQRLCKEEKGLKRWQCLMLNDFAAEICLEAKVVDTSATG